MSPWRPTDCSGQWGPNWLCWGGRCRLTVLALDLGDTGDVSSSEGMGTAGKEAEENQPQEEGRHVEGRHGDLRFGRLRRWSAQLEHNKTQDRVVANLTDRLVCQWKAVTDWKLRRAPVCVVGSFA